MRHVPLVVLLVEVGEVLAGELGVLHEVVVSPLRDALELAPAPGIAELDVARARGIVRELVGLVRADAEHVFGDPVLGVPAVPLADPVFEPLRSLVGRHEEFHLHLLELTRAEDEVPRGDLVAERLADLRDTERRFLACGRLHVLEVDEDALRGLEAQIRD